MTVDSPTTHSPVIDFVGAWRALLMQDRSARLDPEVDRAFWEQYAPYYDARTAPPGSYDHVLEALCALVRPDDTVLDIGAGTGRFAVPLARRVRQVTALDHAPAMLRMLAAKLRAQGVTNVVCQLAEWERAGVVPHDVVLAAWSLYRALDLDLALAKMVAATRRVLVIITSDAFTPPHRPAYEAIWGGMREPETPLYLYVLGALRQIGVRADVRILWETRCYSAPGRDELLRQLAPLDATADQLQRFGAALHAWLQPQDGQWIYRFDVPVPLLIWQRDAGERRFA
ncbi:class I SAM-dependent methyltransferase [Kallotenue papyrolyticum]|uniref:class I SAM-dependent methyltransferase n=1 Tax=Kallotenue papyrolyticum TaxID=1325125 RepID=UPI000492DFB2|nr:methyltransferase domain-containing protein [Kallotenue papyrolyticum]